MTIPYVYSDQAKDSNYQESLLLIGLTRTWRVFLESDDGNNPSFEFQGDGDEWSVLFANWPDAPEVGDQHPNMKNLYAVEFRANPLPDATAAFEAIMTYEGSSGRAKWEDSGNLSQETSNFDHNNKTCVVFPPLGINASNNQGIVPSIRPANLLRFYAQAEKVVTWYSAMRQADYVRFTYLGATNSVTWGSSTDDARTWLFADFQETTDNGVVFKHVATFLWRQRTWDEVALWLDATGQTNGKVSPSLPTPDEFPTSTLGLINETSPPPTNILGWARFIMEKTADFNGDFDPSTDHIPIEFNQSQP